jgi:maleylacetate reductase
VASGLNAVAHCVDSMWAPRTDPVNQALAVEGLRALNLGLPLVVTDPAGLSGREQTLCGAYLSAVAFASAGAGLHHKICHVLGGRHDLPHATTHAIVLPHVLAFNVAHAPAAAERIASALGAPSAAEGLERLRATLDAPRALRDHGFEEHDIPGVARAILPQVPPSNPAPVTVEALEALLRAAWAGDRPG